MHVRVDSARVFDCTDADFVMCQKDAIFDEKAVKLQIPAVMVYQSDYGDILLSKELAGVFKRSARTEKHFNPMDDSGREFPLLVDEELEGAIETIARKAHEAGIELKFL